MPTTRPARATEWLRAGVRVRCQSGLGGRPLLVEVRSTHTAGGFPHAQVMVPGALSGQSGHEAELSFTSQGPDGYTWRHLTLSPPHPIGSPAYDQWLADQVCVELARAAARLRLADPDTRLDLALETQQLSGELAGILQRPSLGGEAL